MLTSNFTLEYSGEPPVPNIPRTFMPPQLKRLGVPQPVWTKIYDRANGVVERAAMREQNKKELDTWLKSRLKKVIWTTGSEEEEELRAKVARDKENHDLMTQKGWLSLLNECVSEIGVYGVSASFLRMRSHINMICGIEFRCNPSKLHANKVKLYCHHLTEEWSWLRERVPAELASLHMDHITWKSVYDEVKTTYDKTIQWESQKKAAQDSLLVSLGDDMVNRDYSHNKRAPVHHSRYKSFMHDMDTADREIESAWSQLLEFAEDTFYMYGISVSLQRSNKDAKTRYCGIILRFKPVVATVPVISETTIAMPLPTAPISDESMLYE